MSRLEIHSKSYAMQTVERLYADLERRLTASTAGVCPVDLALSFLRLCHAQTCGKCAPCRIGLGQLAFYLEEILDGKGTKESLAEAEKLAETIRNSADCALGCEAAAMALRSINGCREDYLYHIEHKVCSVSYSQPVPCVLNCPAEVDIPGYLALAREGKCADAVRLIRKDNPFPTACALICEHPCEKACRRNVLDAPVNIRGIKRFVVDEAGEVPAPACAAPTGKRIAVVGGGPSGLTAAYFLSLMGHKCVVYEMKNKLGGMLRYGIPAYRFPRERLDSDIDHILSTGVEVRCGVKIGRDFTVEQLRREYDAVYVAIGAHTDKKVGIEGEDSKNVISAVELLNRIGNDDLPDFSGKTVVVIGGGNVAMDCVRSSVRLGAKKSIIAYRRRKEDMTALPEEVAGALEEGCELKELAAPVRIEADADGKAAAFWVKPQIIGTIDESGRAKVSDSSKPEERIACDIVIVAIGQGIGSAPFEEEGLPVKRGCFTADRSGSFKDIPGVFAGGDCVSGPATVIRAIAAGKVAAANIDEYLGFDHKISADVRIPEAKPENKAHCARINMSGVEPEARKTNFDHIEYGMTAEEACREAGRCLRCDANGCGSFKGGRTTAW